METPQAPKRLRLLPERLTSSPSLGEIDAFLRRHPEIRSVEAFLKRALPQEALQHSVHMHQSESLQGAHPTVPQPHSDAPLEGNALLGPRVIASSNEGRFIVAFNGSDKQIRGNTVEMMRFIPEEARFELAELGFRGDRYELSEPNPALCSGCHGQDPRPLWGAYPFWKGAYGSYRVDVPPAHADDPESLQASHNAFFKQQARHPRYSALPQGAFTIGGENDSSSANVRMTYLLFSGNDQRVARLARSTPFYDSYKFALAGAYLCNPTSDETSQARRSTRPETPRARERRLMGSQKAFLKTFLPPRLAAAHMKALRPSMLRDHAVGGFTDAVALFDARGIPTDSWAPTLGTLSHFSSSRFSVGTSRNVDATTGTRLGYALLQADPELAQSASQLTWSMHGVIGLAERRFPGALVRRGVDDNQIAKINQTCDTLAEKSQAVLSELLQNQSPKEIFALSAARSVSPRDPVAVLAGCASCHNAGDGAAPRVPFHDVKLLGVRLAAEPRLLREIQARTAPDAGANAMPPGNPLSVGERARLLEFLQKL